MKNKEIEELLNTFKELINAYSPDTEPFTIDYDYEIKYSALKSLLSHIEQLEQCYCNRTDCIGRIKDSKKYDSLLQKYKQLQNNRDKAIEYLKEKADYPISYYHCIREAIDILKGDNDDE